MAHPSMLPPELPDPDSTSQEENAADPAAADSGLLLARLASKLAERGAGIGSADLALDLVLNEIVEQARLATTATGAAIALIRNDEMVCRATSGPNAPDLGVRLNIRSGLSGECVQSRSVQRCDDTETDSRVDTIVSRRLNVRSILIVPIFSGDDLVGVFEIFSPRPYAFGDRDAQTLEALSLRIVNNLESAAERAAQERRLEWLRPLPVEDVKPLKLEDELTVNLEPEIPLERISEPAKKPRDIWTAVLTAIVIGLALLLGWMVGRTGLTPTSQAARSAKSESVRPEQPATAGAAVVEPPASIPTKKPVAPATSKTKLAASEPPRGGLVVYQDGKVIFQLEPASAASATPPVRLASETAATYVVHKVQPEYPDAARKDSLQGKVTLNVVVGKDGKVQKVAFDEGDSRLAEAALNAVRQWRFKPYSPEGKPIEFETAVTVDFKLPEVPN